MPCGRPVAQAVGGVFHTGVQRIGADAVVLVVQAGAVGHGVVRGGFEEASHAHGAECAFQEHFAAVAEEAAGLAGGAVIGLDGDFQHEAGLQALAQGFHALDAEVGVAAVQAVHAAVAGLGGFQGRVQTAVEGDRAGIGQGGGGEGEQAAGGQGLGEKTVTSHSEKKSRAWARQTITHTAAGWATVWEARRQSVGSGWCGRRLYLQRSNPRVFCGMKTIAARAHRTRDGGLFFSDACRGVRPSAVGHPAGQTFRPGWRWACGWGRRCARVRPQSLDREAGALALGHRPWGGLRLSCAGVPASGCRATGRSGL
ncbi:Uncharacterised protein [Comamonas aquatica]|nr:Uncharacterised protein [Comamonas aquatica]